MKVSEEQSQKATALLQTLGINGSKGEINLIATALAQAEERGRLEERERCVKIADDMAKGLNNEWNQKIGKANDLVDTCEDIAAAIRGQVRTGR